MKSICTQIPILCPQCIAISRRILHSYYTNADDNFNHLIIDYYSLLLMYVYLSTYNKTYNLRIDKQISNSKMPENLKLNNVILI